MKTWRLHLMWFSGCDPGTETIWYIQLECLIDIYTFREYAIWLYIWHKKFYSYTFLPSCNLIIYILHKTFIIKLVIWKIYTYYFIVSVIHECGNGLLKFSASGSLKIHNQGSDYSCGLILRLEHGKNWW